MGLGLDLGLPTSAAGPPAPIRDTILVFSTRVDVTLDGVSQARGQPALAALRAQFQAMYRAWHAWNPGPLVQINQALTAGRWATPPPGILALITRLQQIYRESDGRFNPAIGHLIALWGFHSDQWAHGQPPPAQAIHALVAEHPGMDDIEVPGNRVRSRNPAVALDFGAIAKGHGLEQAMQHLKRLGIRDVLLVAADGTVHMTPAMAHKVHFTLPPGKVMLSAPW
ncbi:MAG: FAD:protein FMN transferase [Gammaproteobacteria bacterium]